MKYDFDEIIDRRGTNALNTDGFRQYIFKGDANMRFPYADEEFIRMWVADMEFATPQVVIDAVKERLDQRIFGYTKLLDPQYHDAFSAWANKRYGWTFKREHLVTSPGIIPALYELIAHICRPDEKVLIFTPSYAYFKHAADYNAIGTVCSDLINDRGHFTMDFDDLRAKVQDPKTTLCIFCNPHNPTGRVWSPKELETFGQILIEKNMWIISDEIHCDLLRAGQTHTPLAKIFPDYSRLITAMAPSKTFNMAGMMFSNIIIPEAALMEKWKKRHYDMENPLSITAAQAAYAHGEPWLDQLKVYLDANFDFTKKYLAEHLPEAVFTVPEATYLAWVDINKYLPPDKDLFLPMFFAQNAGVLLEGGNMFVANSEGFIRLNVACPKSVLKTGLERICRLLSTMGK